MKALKTLVVLVVGVGALTLFNMTFTANPQTAAQQKQEEEQAEKLAQAKVDAQKKAAEVVANPPKETVPTAGFEPFAEIPAKAPDQFKIKFETTKGDFVIECYREWAPNGVDRIFQLAKEGVFNDAGFFRVLPDFMVQFGIPADPALAAIWKSQTMQDDPAKQSNSEGMVTFATSGPNSRTTQIFINYKDNSFLDSQGFAPFAKVIQGMEVVKSIHSEYGETPNQGSVQNHGKRYLEREFPNLDYVKTTILGK